MLNIMFGQLLSISHLGCEGYSPNTTFNI